MTYRVSFPAPNVTLHTPTENESIKELCFTVTVCSENLRPYPRSVQQMDLLRQVVYLREMQAMTFDAIAKLLISKGMKSAGGHPLSAELVFSIYKKRPASQRKPV